MLGSAPGTTRGLFVFFTTLTCPSAESDPYLGSETLKHIDDSPASHHKSKGKSGFSNL